MYILKFEVCPGSNVTGRLGIMNLNPEVIAYALIIVNEHVRLSVNGYDPLIVEPMFISKLFANE